MTRKKKQEASQRMKQIWAKRKAAAEVAPPALEDKPFLPNVSATVEIGNNDEIMVLASIIGLMGKLTPAGKQYLVNRFM